MEFKNMRKKHRRITRGLAEFAAKSVRLTGKPVTYLDVSVGRFGDMHGINAIAPDRFVGIDPDEEALQEARKRWNALKKKNFGNVALLNRTITDPAFRLGRRYPSKFTIVACNFTIHYFFESEDKLRNALKNISDALVSGGLFIGTSIDGTRLPEKEAMNDKYIIQCENPSVSEGNRNECDANPSVSDNPERANRNECDTPERANPFGHKYKFKLWDKGSYFNAFERYTEYKVFPETLERIAGDYGLQKLEFREFEKYDPVLASPHEKRISELNFAFFFKKM